MATYVPSRWTIASIASDDALILPHRANPAGSNFREPQVALVADAIKDCSNRGDLILDPFAGSGTTVIAAEKTKRRAALIEIDPLYVDVTIRRWQSYTGAAAMLADTGETFSKREHPPVKAQHENEGS